MIFSTTKYMDLYRVCFNDCNNYKERDNFLILEVLVERIIEIINNNSLNIRDEITDLTYTYESNMKTVIVNDFLYLMYKEIINKVFTLEWDRRIKLKLSFFNNNYFGICMDLESTVLNINKELEKEHESEYDYLSSESSWLYNK